MWLVEMRGDIRELFRRYSMDPLCGWSWLEANRGKRYPQQTIEVYYDGEQLTLPAPSRQTGIKEAMRVAIGRR
jgi:hypothetical protein